MIPSPADLLNRVPMRCIMVSVTVLRGRGGDTQMLLARRAAGYLEGVWSYIAGHVEEGETGAQAAWRELREETGLAPDALYATGFCERFYAAYADLVEIVPAFVAQVADDAVVQLDAEHSQYRWVSLDEAARMLPFGSQRDLLAHVRREFIDRQPSPHLRIH